MFIATLLISKVQSTPDNSNQPLTDFPLGHFLYNFTLNNSNFGELQLLSIYPKGSSYRELTVEQICFGYKVKCQIFTNIIQDQLQTFIQFRQALITKKYSVKYKGILV